MSGGQIVAIAVLAFGLLVLGFLFAPAYLRRARGELTRSERIAKVAAALGLAFSPDDPAFPGSTATRYPFELFSRGERQSCANVITGEVQARRVTAFDFLYLHEDATEPIRCSCAIVDIGGNVPHLVIEPASAIPDAPAAHDGERVALEWGDFNVRYHVFTPERGFATALLDVQVMAWLMDSAPHLALTWETQRGYLLCRSSSIQPEAFAELIRAAIELARRVPKAAGSVA